MLASCIEDSESELSDQLNFGRARIRFNLIAMKQPSNRLLPSKCEKPNQHAVPDRAPYHAQGVYASPITNLNSPSYPPQLQAPSITVEVIYSQPHHCAALSLSSVAIEFRPIHPSQTWLIQISWHGECVMPSTGLSPDICYAVARYFVP